MNFKKVIGKTYLRWEIGENELKQTFVHPGCRVLHLNSLCSSL